MGMRDGNGRKREGNKSLTLTLRKGIKVKRRAGMRIKVDWAIVYGEKEKFQKEKGYREFGN